MESLKTFFPHSLLILLLREWLCDGSVNARIVAELWKRIIESRYRRSVFLLFFLLFYFYRQYIMFYSKSEIRNAAEPLRKLFDNV